MSQLYKKGWRNRHLLSCLIASQAIGLFGCISNSEEAKPIKLGLYEMSEINGAGGKYYYLFESETGEIQEYNGTCLHRKETFHWHSYQGVHFQKIAFTVVKRAQRECGDNDSVWTEQNLSGDGVISFVYDITELTDSSFLFCSPSPKDCLDHEGESPYWKIAKLK